MLHGLNVMTFKIQNKLFEVNISSRFYIFIIKQNMKLGPVQNACISFNSKLSLRSAVGLNAFKLQDKLCNFSLFVENQLSPPTITTLLPAIQKMPLSLRIQKILALLVLCHFVGLVFATLLIESSAGFRNIHHVCESATGKENQKKYFLRYI